MPEVVVEIGGRSFEITCQEGEEHFLMSAAKMLDTEAAELTRQIGRIPEARMLLMAGLMLADKTAGLEEEMNGMTEKLAKRDKLIAEMDQSGGPKPEKIEVPVIPKAVAENLAEIAARTEALAEQIEERSAKSG